MKRNTLPPPPAPVAARPRAAKTPAAQPSLFTLDPVKTNPAPKPIPVEKSRARAASPRPVMSPPAAEPVKANIKTAKTPPPVASSEPVKAAMPSKTVPAKVAVKDAKPKIAKTNPVAKAPFPKAQPVRVVNEPVFEGGTIWKMSGKNGVAYLKDAALAGELLAVDPKKLARSAMAVYYDKKGKAFAWQVRFDTDRWEEIMGRLA